MGRGKPCVLVNALNLPPLSCLFSALFSLVRGPLEAKVKICNGNDVVSNISKRLFLLVSLN